MKRLTAPAAALLLAAATACTTTTTNTNTGAGNTNTNANANANAAATATPAGPTRADIEAKERQTWDALKAKNWDSFAGMLADDFVYVGADGTAGKAQTVEAIRKLDLSEYTFSDIRFVRADADLAVITYTSTDKSTYDGKPSPDKPIRNSTAWVNRGGNWLVVYHQESDVAETPQGQLTPAPGASPSPSPAASPGASPAASPASATDAEKAVWDAIKRRDATAFGNFLAEDSLEVEPEGVYDKAASVRMITGFDASQFTLSDFKETKLDADATLVTYKASGPERGRTVEMYHSTIWTHRGGQWKAAFHQGTYASRGGM